MAILRRDETADPIGPILLFLWDRKWWILGPGILVGLLTFIVLQFVPEEYKVTAEVYANRLTTSDQDSDEAPSPVTVAQLLQSTSVIAAFRDDFLRQFEVGEPPKLERFAKAFKVETEIIQDTSVRKDVSPVIQVSVRARGTSETRFLMDSWLRNFVSQFGDFATREASQKRDALLKQRAEVEQDLRTAETEESRLRSEVALQQKLLGQMMNNLAPADPLSPVTPPERIGFPNQGNDLRLMLSTQKAEGPALLARRAELRLAVEIARTGGSTTSPAALENELTAINTVIADTQTSIGELQKKAAELEQQLSQRNREIVLKTRMLEQLHKSLDEYIVLAAFNEQTSASGFTGPDVRALSSAVMPEEKVWPRRTLGAGSAALATMLLVAIALLLNRYLAGIATSPTRPVGSA